ncbi:TonB-dependent receptor [Sphingosinicella sp. BN140058]|uniref:TonB-dependent receptor n=1 Tax=Sphingosinicella sp. BN140058 TaxID=1892855 RepID=UPI0010128F39|nr:TonB-dependent receptor [Sphingosinicella sp. BN140058]QAY79469.1 TonB-dependent receptor [Sphingosinicella sp. BN140058]
MNKFTLLCASTALMMPAMAFAQSTGSQEVEEEAIVVSGSRLSNGVGGVVVPDVPKTRSILTQEIISRQTAGQSILQTINLIPGVNYTNTDPYGSSGGNLRIRGFPGNRIALLWDGLPLNDTGNYAIFGNQQMDPEVIDQVSVNLGTTDVDSPTPSAAGGVVSYRSLLPTEEFGAELTGSVGDFNYFRTSGIINTGNFGPFDTRAWFQASDQEYDKFRGPGKLHKTQFNARIYQPLGSNGDFFSIAGHFNRNRNNSYNSGTAADYAANRNFDNIDTCVRAGPIAGVADNDGAGTATNNSTPASCTNYYNLRVNPSNTGNIRGSLRVTLADGLILTADPGYQRTLANGGGTSTFAENSSQLRGTSTASGVDLNGDGDTLDTVRVYQPSNTRTNRYTFLTSLIWEATDQHRFRLAYTYDRGEHRQTGEFGRVWMNGDPISVFGGKYNEQARIVSADGKTLQNRDRFSVAQLQQISGEYFGKFLEDKLTVTAGVRAPFFRRELNQNCYTVILTGNPLCTSEVIPSSRIIAPGTPRPTGGFAANALFAPFERTVKYDPILPSAGISFDISPAASVYASYGKNFSSPSTDNLYRSVDLDVTPEKTQNYELGLRYRSPKLQAQVAGYWVNYQDRIVSAADVDQTSPTFNQTLDRNVGDARAYGFDAQASYRPIPELLLYAYGSYIDSKLKEDILGTAVATAAANSPCPAGTPVGQICSIVAVNTKGAEFVETPKLSFGGRAQADIGPVSIGAQFKWVSKRYTTDDNGRAYQAGSTAGTIPILDERGRTPSYTTVDLDGQIDLGDLGFALDRTRLRFSVINVFDKFYFGNISTQTNGVAATRFAVGSPRTFQATLAIGF